MQEKNSQPDTSPLNSFGNQTKKGFIFGLGTGMAIVILFGFLVIFGLYLKYSKTASDNSQPLAQDIQVKPITQDDWLRGDRQARVSIIEFSDTECPFCKRFHLTMRRIVSEYNGQVNWVYRHFPLVSIHPKALQEAQAAECAGQLAGNDGFWRYLDRLFAITPSNNQLDLSELPMIAEYIGLDRNKFEACLNSGKYIAKIQDHYDQAVAAGGQGTPYNIIIINDQKIPLSGAGSYQQLKAILDELLK